MVSTLPSLRGNFAWTLAGNLIYAGCQWGMLVAFAKLTTPEMVGQFALALAVTAPVFMFTSLQLRIVQATDARREYRFQEYFTLRLIANGAACVVVLVIEAVARYQPLLAGIIFVMALAKAVEAVSDVIWGLLQQHEQMSWIARSMILKGATSLAALSLTVYLTRSVLAGLAALTLAWSATLLFYDIRCGLRLAPPSEFRPRWNRQRLLKLAWLTLPMGLVMMLVSLNTNIPRYFIEKVLGQRQLGIFAAMAYLMQAGVTVMNAIGSAAMPRLARYYGELDLAAFRSLLARLLCIAAALGAAAIVVAYVFGRQILSLIYRPEYAAYSSVLIVLMISAAISYIAGFLGTAASALRCFTQQFPITASGSLLGLLCSYFLIPEIGLMGAALTVLGISAFSAFAFGALTLWKLAQASATTSTLESSKPSSQ